MLNPKTKIYILVAGFLSLMTLVIALVAWPLLASLNNQSKDLLTSQAILDLLDKQLAILMDFQDKNSVYQKSVASIESAIVPLDAPIGFMEFLESQAGALGIILTVYPSTIEQDTQIQLLFKIMVEGPFDKCLSFLARLERSPWLIEISGVEISRFSGLRSKETSSLRVGDVSLLITAKTLSVVNPNLDLDKE